MTHEISRYFCFHLLPGVTIAGCHGTSRKYPHFRLTVSVWRFALIFLREREGYYDQIQRYGLYVNVLPVDLGMECRIDETPKREEPRP